MVGLRGFEPPTSPTPRECATGLRHSPNRSYVIGTFRPDQRVERVSARTFAGTAQQFLNLLSMPTA